jgi:hypothetical protein
MYVSNPTLRCLLCLPQVRKPAEEALTDAGNSPGFIQALLAIIANTANDADLRLSAIICLKRTLKSHWKPRKAGVYGLGDDEKAGLKQWLLGHVEEPERKVAVQLAVVVADIARRDWPGDWEPLFPSLLATIHSVRPPAHLDPSRARCIHLLLYKLIGSVEMQATLKMCYLWNHDICFIF